MTITVFAIFKVTNTSSSFAYISIWFLVVLSLVGKPDAQLRHLVTEDSPRTLLRFKGKTDVFFHLLIAVAIAGAESATGIGVLVAF